MSSYSVTSAVWFKMWCTFGLCQLLFLSNLDMFRRWNESNADFPCEETDLKGGGPEFCRAGCTAFSHFCLRHWPTLSSWRMGCAPLWSHNYYTFFFLIRGGEKTSGNAIKEWLTAVALCRPRHLRVSSDCSVKTQLSRKKDHSCGFQRFEVRARGGDFSRGESPLTKPLSRLMTSGFTPVGLYWLSQHLNASTLFVNSHCPKPLNTHISLIADPGDPQVPAPATGQPRLWLVVTCAILDKI